MPVWWPRFIVKPRVRLSRPRFRMPARPPDIIIFGAMFLAVLFILGGNIYTLVKTPPAIAANTLSTPILIAPSIDVQLGLEGIVASAVIFIGTVGIGLIYLASKYVFQPGYATRLMILGAVLGGTAFLIMSYLYSLK